jgi:tRNA 2-thiocytidine biosynthesis protein TtcA
VSSLRDRLRRNLAHACQDFGLIEEGDRILSAVSGGAHSVALLAMLEDLRRRAPVRFELRAWLLDLGSPDRDVAELRRALEGHGFPCEVDRAALTPPPDRGDCYCPVLQGGTVYRAAQRLGCNKIALGHHRDDALETFLLNLLFAGQIRALPPKLAAGSGSLVVIRPLLYCAEADLVALVRAGSLPAFPRRAETEWVTPARAAVRALLAELEARTPGVRGFMLAALRHVRPTHLPDRRLWSALGLDIASPRR